MPLQIVQTKPNNYHFKTKDNQRVDIEHRNRQLVVTLHKWGEEASLEISLDMVLSDKHQFLENKIELENEAFKLRAYPIEARSTSDLYGDSEDMVQCHEGGVRFELVLKSKPSVNFFTIPIKAKNLRFSYQPFLTDEEIEAGHIRPLNVEGSYAVYHTTKKNNQYMTGKAFHICRPIAEDALGNKAWCKIEIDKKATCLTITIPQQFLDEATYPVTIDPDFGYTSTGGSTRAIGVSDAVYRAGSAWTMPASGETNYLRAYIGGPNVANCKAFINQKDSEGANSHGQIATKENLNCAAAAHWEEFTLTGASLIAESAYLLNIMAFYLGGIKETYAVYYDANGAVASYWESQASYASPESPWNVSPEATTLDYSIYVNYTKLAVKRGLFKGLFPRVIGKK